MERQGQQRHRHQFRRPQSAEVPDRGGNIASFTLDKIKNEINQLKTNSAAGDDNILNRLLKEIPDEAVEAIWRIFNLAVSVGYFPRQWIRARVQMVP